jgi:hypothetical protein
MDMTTTTKQNKTKKNCIWNKQISRPQRKIHKEHICEGGSIRKRNKFKKLGLV